ncbi:MAG: hypothetical protein IMX02_03890 [Limnochordaceae bacterium]|nr:hypothetical protein [Limnochordaceae bacterium]
MFAASWNASCETAAPPATCVAAAAAAVWLAGVAIKLVDGVVDQEPGYDPAASITYAVLATAAAVLLRASWASSLLVAAWSAGMAGRAYRQAWPEVAAVVAATGWLAGWQALAGAAVAILAVQALDHWVDGERWPLAGPGPLRGAWLAVGVALAVAGALVDPLETGLVLVMTPPAEAVARRLGRRAADGPGAGEEGQPGWSSPPW